MDDNVMRFPESWGSDTVEFSFSSGSANANRT
jgi:hypothetical protein